MIRNHIQRLTGWNVPNITISTSNDDSVENSDYGIVADSDGDQAATNSYDSATDENNVTNVIATCMQIDENRISTSQNLQPNKNSLRRTSDGSDGLIITSAALDEKENQTTTSESATGTNIAGILIEHHPISPFGTVSNRHSNNYRSQSPLSTATSANTINTQYFSSLVQSPKNHLYSGATFETYNHSSKIIASTSSPSSLSSSPRRSARALSHHNIRPFNSPRYPFSSQSQFTSSNEDSTTTDQSRNPTSSEFLSRVNEILSDSSSEIDSKSQQMNDFEKSLAYTAVVECDDASNKNTASSCTKATTSSQSQVSKELGDDNSTSESFHSNLLKRIDQTSNKEETIVFHLPVVDLTNEYKWAYDIWKKHGLLSNRDCVVQMSPNTTRRLHINTNNSLPHGSSHINADTDTMTKNEKNTDPSKKETVKSWKSDRVGSFSNILDKWKFKTEVQPFDSPGSCTVMQRASLQPSNTAPQKLRKSYTTGASRNDLLPSATIILNTKNEEKESDIPKRKTSSPEIKNSQPRIISKPYVRHPAASLPIQGLKADSLQEGSSSPIPKSQAWKLKSSRDFRLQQRSTEQRNYQRTSWNPNASMVDRGKQSMIQLSESKKCISSIAKSYEMVGKDNRSKSTLRGTARNSPNVDGNSLAIPEFTLPVPNLSTGNAALGRLNSQPRDYQTFRTTAATAIQENNYVKIQQKECSNAIEKTKTLRVMDINNFSVNKESTHEIENIAMQFEDDAFVLSPYTQRVMRNLAKIYNENDNVKTPRASETTKRPWQHDQLLHRVGSITGESKQVEYCQCSCSHSIFSGTDDLIEFFLPLMGTACMCGKARPGIKDANQPTSLVNILRPWQREFLSLFGIHCGEELVKSFHRSGPALAKAMLKYRKNEGMTPYPLKSCVMALQIWSKTSKTFVRSIRDQLAALWNISNMTHSDDDKIELKVPNTLYILSSFMDKVQHDDDDSDNQTALFMF